MVPKTFTLYCYGFQHTAPAQNTHCTVGTGTKAHQAYYIHLRIKLCAQSAFDYTAACQATHWRYSNNKV